MKSVVKLVLNACAALVAAPLIVWAKLGQWVLRSEMPYSGAAYALAVVPGYPGLFLRRAFYCSTLTECAWDLTIGFGSVVTHPTTRIARNVWIGAYSLIGTCRIERDVIIGSRVSVLSGRRPHRFDARDTRIADQPGEYKAVTIGPDSWLGEGSIVMADLGQGVVVGAGAVVVKPVPAFAVMGGNPAKQIGTRGGEPATAGPAYAGTTPATSLEPPVGSTHD